MVLGVLVVLVVELLTPSKEHWRDSFWWSGGGLNSQPKQKGSPEDRGLFVDMVSAGKPQGSRKCLAFPSFRKHPDLAKTGVQQ